MRCVVKLPSFRACSFAVFLVLFCASGAFAQAADHAREFTVEIAGEELWKETGVELQPGDRLILTASGELQYLGEKPTGPEGMPRGWKDLLRLLPLNQAGRGALLGRISDSGQPFLIGERREMTAGAAGRLFLGINQTSSDTGKGSYTVRITLTASESAAMPAVERFAAREVDSLPGITRKLFEKIPRRVKDPDGTPGDMVNFLLLGDEETIRQALQEAGWVKVDRTTKDSLLRGAIATLSKQAYVELPMSELHLFGRGQDYGFAHAEPFVVVARRHHFRIWKASFEVEGQAVWVGAGTHDIGFERDQRKDRITHKIDPNVDEEREFIRASLSQTGRVADITYLTPREPIRKAKTAHGADYYSDGRVLVMRLPSSGLDRSQMFSRLFCSVLAAQPDAKEWGDCAQYIEKSDAGQAELSPIPTQYRILIVPGVMNSCAESTPAYQEGQQYLREKYGLTVDLLAVPNESAESNAWTIADWLQQQRFTDPRKFIVFGYSKGAPDLHTMLALEPDAAEHVAAFVSVAGAIGGSPIADVMPAIADRWMNQMQFGTCRGSMAEAFKSLKREVRQAFNRQYPTPRVPSYSLAAVADEGRVSRMLKQTWQLMSSYDRRQDGQLTIADATVPGSLFLGSVLADHFAVALPLANAPEEAIRSMVDRNRYPRTALLEAMVRFVVQDLESRKPTP